MGDNVLKELRHYHSVIAGNDRYDETERARGNGKCFVTLSLTYLFSLTICRIDECNIYFTKLDRNS